MSDSLRAPLASRAVSPVFAAACAAACVLAGAMKPAAAATAIQLGASGKTYASAAIACALHPVAGWSPQVVAGLYSPAARTTATVSVNGGNVATLTFAAPVATVWLPNGLDAVTVALSRRVADTYRFNATPTFVGQPNVCIPDTRANATAGDLEYAASGKSYAVATPGCALNPQTGLAQPYVNLFDNGSYLLNVSVNGVALTQMSATRPHAVVFLKPGWNVITAANGTLSTDTYVRDGGSGSCTLP